jgi:hypothetical protein
VWFNLHPGFVQLILSIVSGERLSWNWMVVLSYEGYNI